MKPLSLPEASNTRDYSAIDPLDTRYYDPEIARYLSERSRIAYQAHVEVALAYTLADFDICKPAIAKKIEAAATKVRAEDVYAEEETTKHDIKALVNCLKHELSSDAQPFVHFGATSYDVISTATALQLRTTVENLLTPRLKLLITTLIDMSKTHVKTTQIGRTHGQHAVPITFGFAMAEYVSRLGEGLLAINDLSAALKGKFSGAVGAYNALSIFVIDPQKFEKTLLARLGLEPAPYSTQIIPAENIIRLVDELAIIAGIMANLSHDMRHLQRSEISEVRERFEKGQTGSSTMAHKRNPWNFENIISMSKQVTAQTINANLNISSEHQRDLTDSASSRFYTLPFALVASMAERLNKVMSRIEVDEDRMQHNLYLSGGAIAAEPLYLLLEKYGHTSAHESAKELAHSAVAKQKSLYELVTSDNRLVLYVKQFTDREHQILKNPEKYYTGLAAQKATAVAEKWTSRINSI